MAGIQDSSVGIVNEVTYGTAVAVTRFLEFVEESFGWEKSTVQGAGLRVGGRVPRTARRVVPKAMGTGGVTVEALSKGQGLLWEAALGTGTSTLVSTSLYQQNFTLADTLKSLTIQKGLVDASGTVQPYTFKGCVVSGVEFSVPQGEVATAKFDFDIRDLDTAVAYAAPSYPTGGTLFHFGQAAITIGGTVTAPTTTTLATGGTAATNVRDFTLSIDNGLSSERFNYGGGGRKAKPIPSLRAITGSITVELTDTVMRDAMLNETSVPIVLTLTGTETIGAGTSALQVVLSDCRIDGDLPVSNGTELVATTYNFTVLDNLTAAQPIYVCVRTADTAL